MKVAVHLEGRRVRGSERQALLLVRGLVARGHEVVAACRRGGPVEAGVRAAGARTSAVRPRGDLDLLSALRFAAWLRREAPDALLLTSWKRVVVAGWAARVAGVPRVVMRMGGPHRLGGGAGAAVRRHAFRGWYHAIVTNSHEVRDAVLADLPGYPPDRVPVIPNAVAPMLDAPSAAPPLPSLPEDVLRLVAVGGLEALKGYDVLAWALARLDPGVHLLVAGGGSRARRRAVESAFEAAGASARVHLLGHRDDVPGLLALADAFVHASRTDSMPNAMLEAMAAGLPVVASRVGGAEAALGARDGRGPAGWLVPVDDSDALGSTLAEVAAGLRSGDPAVAARAEEARWRGANWFDVETMVERYEAVLQ